MIFWLCVILKKVWETNSNIRLIEVLCNLVVSFCAKFVGCATKTVGEVGFLVKAYFFAITVLVNPCSRLPEFWYWLEIRNGRSHWHIRDVCKIWWRSERFSFYEVAFPYVWPIKEKNSILKKIHFSHFFWLKFYSQKTKTTLILSESIG